MRGARTGAEERKGRRLAVGRGALRNVEGGGGVGHEVEEGRRSRTRGGIDEQRRT